MADYNSSFTGAQIDAGIAKANSAQQPPAEGAFVDGDKTKLDGIEAGADVTDTTSVTAAGALMDSEVANLEAVKAFDPTDYATAAQGALADSAQQPPSEGAFVDGDKTKLDSAVQPGDDASTLGSGAATDGYVLTADGIGGAAWEAASGGGATDYVRTRAGSIQDLFNMADTWNDALITFTAIKMNVTDTASSASSLLMDLQVGGVSKFRVKKDGTFSAPIGTPSAPTFSIADDDDSGLNFSATYIEFVYSGTSRGIAGVDDGAAMFKLPDSGFFGWSPNATVPSTSDLRLYRDAAGTLAQRNGTNAQTFNIYNTYTDASNYERLKVGWNANALELKPEAAGAGTTRVLHISGLPTANPGPGILWNDAGTVKVGT